MTRALHKYLQRIGRAGGKKGGPKGGAERAKRLSAEQRKTLAEMAAKKRWRLDKRCKFVIDGKKWRCILEKHDDDNHKFFPDEID